MVFMPHDTSGKDCKLVLSYHGPYRIMDMHSNCISVKPVDKPDDESILVNLDRILPCPAEVPDSSWLDYGNTTETHKRPHKNLLTAITPARPADHHYATRSKATVYHVCSMRTSYSLRGRKCKTILYVYT